MIEQKNTAVSQSSGNKVAEVTATVTPASTSTQMQEDDVLQWLKNPAAVDSFAFGQIEKVFMQNCYYGLTASSPYIKSELDTLVEKEKPLQRFSAYIESVEKTSDSKYQLTIDKVEVNPKFELGAQGTEPFLINEKAEPETIEVSSNVFLVINTAVSISIDEKFMEYIQPTGGHYFDFYACNDEVLFILEGVMP